MNGGLSYIQDTSTESLAECVASGTLSATTDIPAHRELTGDGGAAAFVSPDDPVGTAAALARLLADPHLRSEMGQQASTRARAYSLDAHTVSHVRLYTKLAAVSCGEAEH